MLLSVSEVGRESNLKDDEDCGAGFDRKRATDIMLEAVRWRAMKRLSTQFRDIVGERLGTGWPRHFEKWLFSRRSAGSCARCSDPIFPSSDVVMNDAELQRKLVASGLQEAYAGTLCRMIGQAAIKAALSAARANLGSGRKGRVAVEELEMIEGERRRVKLRLSCGGMSVEINEVHFRKLRALYRGETGGGGGDHDAALAKWGGAELVGAVFRVLARYSAYQGAHFKAGGVASPRHPLKATLARAPVSRRCGPSHNPGIFCPRCLSSLTRPGRPLSRARAASRRLERESARQAAAPRCDAPAGAESGISAPAR